MKTILIVLDSFGVGALPDAKKYGDEGSNTYLNTLKATGIKLDNMISLGLNNIDGIELSHEKCKGSFARLSEKTNAKDTTAGHYEISGLILENPYPTFKNGFPKKLLKQIKKECGVEFIGNEVASGTEIIKRLGKEHLESKKPILYTSADSVLQIASHIDILSLDKLYSICEKIRKICKGEFNVGRIIARPFATNDKGEFYRVEARKDFALEPPKPTMLDKLTSVGLDTICIGKIEDIFCNRGISESYHTKNNSEGIVEILKQVNRKDINGLIFANLNDTDMLYGHRNDVLGYANVLKQFDIVLPDIVRNISKEDVLIITADHGCDPTTPSTDHSREYVPLLVYGKELKSNINFGTIHGFDIISKSILDVFGVETFDESLFRKLI